MRPTRVLIADDYPDIRRGMASLLAAEGFEVSQASDGREAIELYASSLDEGRPFDVAVLDHLMPHYKGDVVAMRLRELAEGRGVAPPAMFMLTGSNDSALMSRVKAAGLSEIYIKPELTGLIDRIVGRPAVARAVSR